MKLTTKQTHFCVIRIPHQMPATIHFDVPVREEVTQEMLDEHNEIMCEALMSDGRISDISEYVPTDTIDIDGWDCRVGDYIPDPFWHDAHDCIVFDSEQEMIDYYPIGHQALRVKGLINNYFSKK